MSYPLFYFITLSPNAIRIFIHSIICYYIDTFKYKNSWLLLKKQQIEDCPQNCILVDPCHKRSKKKYCHSSLYCLNRLSELRCFLKEQGLFCLWNDWNVKKYDMSIWSVSGKSNAALNELEGQRNMGRK